MMKLKQLQMILQRVRSFDEPKVELEQYPTGPEVASQLVYAMATAYGDVEDKVVLDMGCGPAMLSIGCALMGAQWFIGVDIDTDALAVATANLRELDIVEAGEFILADVFAVTGLPLRKDIVVDTIVMNPPFGTRRKGADMAFVEAGLALKPAALYSLHKTSTRKHILRKAEQWGVEAEVVAQLRYDIPAMYSFHKSKSKDIEVDFWRFTPLNGAQKKSTARPMPKEVPPKERRRRRKR